MAELGARAAGLDDRYPDPEGRDFLRDRRDAHLISSVPQDLRCRIGVVLTQVGEQDTLTYAHPAGQSLDQSDLVQ